MMKFTVMFIFLCIVSFKNWKMNTISSKSIKLRKLRILSFDRTRGEKKQIFPTQNPSSQGLPVSIFTSPNIRLNTNSILGQAVAKNLPATIFRSRSDDHFLWGNVNKRHTTRDRQCRCYKQKLVQQWTFDPHSLVPLKWHQASWIQKALWCKESKQFENYNQTTYILCHRVPSPHS